MEQPALVNDLISMSMSKPECNAREFVIVYKNSSVSLESSAFNEPLKDCGSHNKATVDGDRVIALLAEALRIQNLSCITIG